MSTRRVLLAGSAAAIATAPSASGQSHPDSELVAACQAFDALERDYQKSFHGAWDDMPEFIAEEKERDRLVGEQEPYLATICATPAKTVAALQAKARSLVLWDEYAMEDDPVCTDDRIRSSLLRDLLSWS